MYVEDTLLGEALNDDSATIWRYLTLPAFLEILQKKTLFFPAIAKLAEVDPWEGHWSEQEFSDVLVPLQEALDVDWRGSLKKHFKKHDLCQLLASERMRVGSDVGRIWQQSGTCNQIQSRSTEVLFCIRGAGREDRGCTVHGQVA